MQVQAMRWKKALSALFVPALLASGPVHAAVPPLVYRVDTVSATITDRHLVVTASGAVTTGGWQHPRLRALHARREAPVLVFDFVADPPRPKKVVIQALLPVRATLKTELPHHGVVAVEIVTHSNEITTQVIPDSSATDRPAAVDRHSAAAVHRPASTAGRPRATGHHRS